MDETDEEVTLGDLHAGHLGLVIALGREDFFPYLVGALASVRHRPSNDPQAGPSDDVTEIVIYWGRQRITIEEASTEPVVIRALKSEPFELPPEWDNTEAADQG
jgi:hypothetical protein